MIIAQQFIAGKERLSIRVEPRRDERTAAAKGQPSLRSEKKEIETV